MKENFEECFGALMHFNVHFFCDTNCAEIPPNTVDSFLVLPSLSTVYSFWWSRCLRVVYTNYPRNELAQEACSRNCIWRSCCTVVTHFVELSQYARQTSINMEQRNHFK